MCTKIAPERVSERVSHNVSNMMSEIVPYDLCRESVTYVRDGVIGMSEIVSDIVSHNASKMSTDIINVGNGVTSQEIMSISDGDNTQIVLRAGLRRTFCRPTERGNCRLLLET